MIDSFSFGEQLKAFRIRAGLSQAQLADSLRMNYKISASRNTISNWETDTFRPKSREVVLKLAIELHLNPEETDSLLRVAEYPLEYKHSMIENLSQPQLTSSTMPNAQLGSAPPLPPLLIGRENDLRNLRQRLKVVSEQQLNNPVLSLIAMHGWPGVGKTTIAAALAHDLEIASTFPHGVLWASIGPKPDLFTELVAWGRALGIPEITQTHSISEVSAQLSAFLRNQRRLLIVDDVWEVQHIEPFKVGGQRCALIVTTRLSEVAYKAAPTAKDVYTLQVLTDENAFNLMRTIAPTVTTQNPRAVWELVQELEGLPLAIQVAGRLLHMESSYGFGAIDLLKEIREGAKLLESQAPIYIKDSTEAPPPTVAVLLRKSTDRLNTEMREYFTLLGAFAPKPAKFDINAMSVLWQIENPKHIAYHLVSRGLLEAIDENFFQMHALLAMHARSLIND